MINALLWAARYWAWLALMTLLSLLSLVYFSVRTISTEKKNITIESVDIRLAQSVSENANKASRALINVAHRITEYAKPSAPLGTDTVAAGVAAGLVDRLAKGSEPSADTSKTAISAHYFVEPSGSSEIMRDGIRMRVNFSATDFYRNTGKVTATPYYFSPASGFMGLAEPPAQMVLTKKLGAAEKNPGGILATVVDITAAFDERSDPHLQNNFVALYRNDGLRLMHTGQKAPDFDQSALGQTLQAAAQSPHPQAKVTRMADERTATMYRVAFQAVPAFPGLIAAQGLSQSDALAPALEFENQIYAASLAAGMILVLMMLFAARTVQGLTASLERHQEEKKHNLRFLHMTVHELRSTVHGILGYADLLQHELHAPEDKEGAETISKFGQHLINLIDRIQTVSSLALEPTRPQASEFELSTLLDTLVRTHTPIALRKNVALETAFTEAHIFSDKIAIASVMHNLLSNALKYTKDGSISVTSEVSGGIVRIAVTDSGCGIADNEKKHLFEAYFRGKKGNSSDPSAGLGLYYCKQLIEGMNGKIGYHRNSAEGTTVWFEFPQKMTMESSPRNG